MQKVNDIERKIVTVAIIVVILFGIQDYYEDMSQGATLADLTIDTLMNLFVLVILYYIWQKRPHFLQKHNQHLELVLKKSNKDAHRWQEKASHFLEGLGQKINEQLTDWRLSHAEKEVALLLIKGLSLREIASVRGTSEKTVRQQASQIYAKANLENRAELAAFFLEDLLLPQ